MTKAVTLHLSEPIFEKAKALAAKQNLPLHDLLVGAISLPELGADPLARNGETVNPETQSPETQSIEQEEIAFQAMHSSLVKDYLGKYVAILDSQMIDHDTDQVDLYLRIRQAYPDRFVLIAQVQTTPEEILHFRSPHLSDKATNGTL